ncbi:MAG: hypothetical protein ACRDNI_10795 [Gaiellaceae bacterium]
MSAMRRVGTWLVVGVLAALGIAAGVDVLRAEAEAEEAPRPAPSDAAAQPGAPDGQPDGAAAELSAAGMHGVVTYADETCRLHAVSLPGLEPHPVEVTRSCRFTVSSGVVSFGRARPDPGLFLTAECRRGRVQVRTSDGYLLARFRGCAPAWRSGGLLAIIRDGGVVELSGPLAERRYVHERVVLSRREVERELRQAGWAGSRFALREFAWLPGRRIAAIVRARSADQTTDLLAVFSDGRLVSAPGFGYDGLGGLRPSPLGRFVAARVADPGGLAVVDRDGRPVRLPLPYATSVAWSPNERWVAEAVDDGIAFFPTEERNPRPIFVPIIARDLVWR